MHLDVVDDLLHQGAVCLRLVSAAAGFARGLPRCLVCFECRAPERHGVAITCRLRQLAQAREDRVDVDLDRLLAERAPRYFEVDQSDSASHQLTGHAQRLERRGPELDVHEVQRTAPYARPDVLLVQVDEPPEVLVEGVADHRLEHTAPRLGTRAKRWMRTRKARAALPSVRPPLSTTESLFICPLSMLTAYWISSTTAGSPRLAGLGPSVEQGVDQPASRVDGIRARSRRRVNESAAENTLELPPVRRLRYFEQPAQ